MKSRLEIFEYRGYSIQIQQDQQDEITGDIHWTFCWGKNGQPLRHIGKIFTGYDTALEEAENFIDTRIIDDA